MIFYKIQISNNRTKFTKLDQFLICIKEAIQSLFKNKTNNNFKNKKARLVDSKIPNRVEKALQNRIIMLFKNKVQRKNIQIIFNS